MSDVAFAPIQPLDLAGIDIEPQRPKARLEKRLNQRQTDVAKADDANQRLAAFDLARQYVRLPHVPLDLTTPFTRFV